MLSKTVGLKPFWPNSTAPTNRGRLRTCLSASVLALVCIGITSPAVAQSRYDGSWSVVINTRGGACESGVRYGVQIVNGRVVSGGEGANVQGRVAPNGAVRVAVQAGGQWANGSGHLSMTRGGGVWRGHGSAGYCQGTWVAQRTGYGAKAQAEVPGRPIYNYAPRYYARRYYVPRRYYAPRYYQPAPPPGQY
jgi:hypothetical protein